MLNKETEQKKGEPEKPLFTLQSVMTFRDYREFAFTIGHFTLFFRITAALIVVMDAFMVLRNLPMSGSELAGRIIVGFVTLVIWLVVIRAVFHIILRIGYRRTGGEHDHHSEILLYENRLEDRGPDMEIILYYKKLRAVYETHENFMIMSTQSFGSVISKRACSGEVRSFIRSLDPRGRLSKRFADEAESPVTEKKGYELLR
ncbi:MAG: hypothetical protein K5985_01940 [Lachnospiraceae bacterium]|nr:hypothetical protein [Lachnospiraceae bacterium]